MRHAMQRPSLQQITYQLHVCGMNLHWVVTVELLKYNRPSIALDHLAFVAQGFCSTTESVASTHLNVGQLS